MLDAALTPRPRKTLLVLVATAAFASVAVWVLALTREYGRDDRTFLHGPSAFSLWRPLRDLGCAPPNEHGTFIAGKLLPDEHGDPYIFECTADGLTIDGVSVQ